MKYNKLNISDAERKQRRARQLAKATYKCTCGRSTYSKPGEEWICGKCYRASLQREMRMNGKLLARDIKVGTQMELFTLDLLFPWVPMKEQLRKAAKRHLHSLKKKIDNTSAAVPSGKTVCQGYQVGRTNARKKLPIAVLQPANNEAGKHLYMFGGGCDVAGVPHLP